MLDEEKRLEERPPDVSRYVSECLSSMRKTPLMWGPLIAIELQYLLLLELREIIWRGKDVRALYGDFLRREYPQLGPNMLSSIFTEDVVEDFMSVLLKFEQELDD